MINVNFLFSCPANYTKIPFTVKPHKHPYYELIYYISGTGVSTIQDMNFDYLKNTYTIIPPNIMHSEISTTAANIYLIAFELQTGLNIDFPLKLFYDNNQTIYALINRIRNEMLNKEAYYNIKSELLVKELLLDFARANTKLKHESTADIINYSIKYIDSYFATEISMQTLANSIGYSYDHFRHEFKRQVGVSPYQYVMSLKLSQAKSLLKHTDKSIQKIAKEVGIISDSNFILHFKKEYGITPTEYRERSKNERPVAVLN